MRWQPYHLELSNRHLEYANVKVIAGIMKYAYVTTYERASALLSLTTWVHFPVTVGAF